MEDHLKEADLRLKEASGEEKGPMGLTPDHIKATPEWKNARNAFDSAMKAVQTFNRWFCREFKAEYAADRKAKREASSVSPV